MKDITECMGNIGRANSKPHLRLLANEAGRKSQHLTTFMIPGKGQFHWIMSPMWLLGCPASFQRLMEGVLRNISNVIIYINDLLVHSDTHEKHIKVLEQVLTQLHQNHLKINLEKCILGTTLTLKGIKPGKKTNSRPSKRPNHPPTSKPSGPS